MDGFCLLFQTTLSLLLDHTNKATVQKTKQFKLNSSVIEYEEISKNSNSKHLLSDLLLQQIPLALADHSVASRRQVSHIGHMRDAGQE